MKRNLKKGLIALSVMASLSISSLPAYAYVKTAVDGTTATYNLGTLLDTKYTDKDISRMNDSAVYSDGENEYVYVMDKSAGVFCFKRINGDTVSYEPISLGKDFRINNFHYDITYKTLDVQGNKLYLVQQKNKSLVPRIMVYSLENPEQPQQISSIDLSFKLQGMARGFKVDGNKAYIISDTGFGIRNVSDESSQDYSFSECASIMADVPDSMNGSIEAKNGYIYISGKDTNGKLSVWALKETESGIVSVGKKTYIQSSGYTADSIIINNVLYVSAVKGTNYEAGVYAIDISNPEDFANAASKNNAGNKASTDLYSAKLTAGMNTDGRYLFVSDYSDGVIVYDTLGGVDLLPVGGNQSMSGTSIDVANGRVYQINNSSNNVNLYVWDYVIADENDKIGYAYNGNNASTVQNSGAAYTDRNQLNTSLNSYAGNTSDGTKTYVQLLKNDSDITTTYTVTSQVDCKKKLYLQARMRRNANVSVSVNGKLVRELSNLAHSNGSDLMDHYLCDVDLVKGENTISVNIVGTVSGSDASTADNIQVGGIAISKGIVGDEDGISFAKTEFSTVPTAGTEVTAKTICWQSDANPTDINCQVIYAAYGGKEERLLDVFITPVSFDGIGDTQCVSTTFEVPEGTVKIARFVFNNLDVIYPMTSPEYIELN